MTEAILHFKNHVQDIHRKQMIFWTLSGILLLCAGLYIYSVTTTIHNVVSRQNLEAQASQLTVQMSTEEYQYIALRNNITLSYAQSLGFKEVVNTNFISRSGNAQVSYLSR